MPNNLPDAVSDQIATCTVVLVACFALRALKLVQRNHLRDELSTECSMHTDRITLFSKLVEEWSDELVYIRSDVHYILLSRCWCTNRIFLILVVQVDVIVFINRDRILVLIIIFAPFPSIIEPFFKHNLANLPHHFTLLRVLFVAHVLSP